MGTPRPSGGMLLAHEADVDAIILAGGRARRLGGVDKGALVYEGRTLLERSLDAASMATVRVVVGDCSPARVPPGVRTVREEPIYSGPASAVMAGVDALAVAGSTATWAFVLACDVARSAELTRPLLAALEGHPDSDGIVPVDEESRRQSLVGLYRVSALRAARESIGDVAGVSMNTLLGRLRLVEIQATPGSTSDVDTPEQARSFGIEVPGAIGVRMPSVEDARQYSYGLGAARLTPRYRVGLESAAGLTLADDVAAQTSLPAFANSAMDGWAVCGPGPWRLGAPIHAGDRIDHLESLQVGNARPIMTGAEVPGGAWAVVRSEDGVVSQSGDSNDRRLSLPRELGELRHGHHIRSAGEEAAAGDIVLRRGDVLTPPRLGLAAACGHDDLSVRRPPVVDLLVVGDELITSGASGNGKVRDALSPQLLPLIASLGASIHDVARVHDDPSKIRSAIQDSAADLVVVTGGTSIGDADHTRAVLDMMGAHLVIDGISMRPGRPALVAVCDSGTVVICLPGNPLAGLLAAEVLLGPLVRGMLGRSLKALPAIQCAENVPNPRPDSMLVPYRLTSEGEAASTGWSGSGMLRGIAMADGVAIIPEGGAMRGQQVRTLPLSWARA